jgi:hypothetical protein
MSVYLFGGGRTAWARIDPWHGLAHVMGVLRALELAALP